MKKCPKCNNFYPAEDDFCPNDGTLLSGSAADANRVVVSWGEKPAEPAPTQFIPPQQVSHQVPQQAGANNGILYALIGALVAVVIIGGIYIMSGGSKDEARWSSPTPTSTPATNQTQANKPANVETTKNKPAAVPMGNTNTASSSGPRLARTFNNSFDGTLDGHGIQMKLERDGRSLSGSVTPTRRNAADIYLAGTIEDDGSFVMDEKSDTGVVTGIYRGRLTADGTMSGTWTKPNGDRACSFALSRM